VGPAFLVACTATPLSKSSADFAKNVEPWRSNFFACTDASSSSSFTFEAAAATSTSASDDDDDEEEEDVGSATAAAVAVVVVALGGEEDAAAADAPPPKSSRFSCDATGPAYESTGKGIMLLSNFETPSRLPHKVIHV